MTRSAPGPHIRQQTPLSEVPAHYAGLGDAHYLREYLKEVSIRAPIGARALENWRWVRYRLGSHIRAADPVWDPGKYQAVFDPREMSYSHNCWQFADAMKAACSRGLGDQWFKRDSVRIIFGALRISERRVRYVQGDKCGVRGALGTGFGHIVERERHVTCAAG